MRLGTEDRTIRRTLVSLVLGAVALRLLLFTGRGDYVAFDEAWYLLLGQNLWSGDGYRLTGLRHTTLSPLFPILAGGVARVLGDPVWAGRIVAAVTSGLLVLPCWSIFRRMAGRRTALLACAIVALTPSLAPFVVPELVGWDLWVGAEPVYHLSVYAGVAIALRAMERQRPGEWAAAGVCLGLAYLARSEAVVVAGLLGLAVLAVTIARGASRRILPAVAAVGLAFCLVAGPYWLYLRDVTGHWTLTGRVVQVGVAETDGPGPSDVIEGMLWAGRHAAYVRDLYSLDASGTRLGSTYWGVPETSSVVPSRGAEVATAATRGPGSDQSAGHGATKAAPLPEDPAVAADTIGGEEAGSAGARPAELGRPRLYVSAFGKLVPGVLVPFILLGIVLPRRRSPATELVFSVPLLGTSLLIAGLVAIDPRTQLFLMPALAFYAARGVRAAGALADARIPGHALRRGLVPALLVLVAVASLALEDARRLYMSHRIETVHAYVAAENRRAGEELRGIIPEGQSVMSFHPAIALYARRDWRALPIAPLPSTFRYAVATDCEYIVLSMYNPSPLDPEQMPRPFLVVPVPDDPAAAPDWLLTLAATGEKVAIASVAPN
ncbi:MAG TPA: glycosyltransferase family 39 protein [Longimicrobiales bacterium]